MATMKLFRPGCGELGCTRRPTWEIEGANGEHGLYCAVHATKALKALEYHERAQAKRPTQPTAVRG